MTISIGTSRLHAIRFGWLYSSEAPREHQPWNTVLAECEAAVALPSKGSMVPGWVLSLPRRPVLNLSHLTADERTRLLAFSHQIATKVSHFAPHLAQFEHGATEPASLMGCGVDLAHLHTIPLPFNLISEALKRTTDLVSWTEASNFDDPWVDATEGEYIVVRDLAAKRAVMGTPKRAESQLIRRVIAAAIDHANKWDYSAFPCTEQVAVTLRAFGGQ